MTKMPNIQDDDLSPLSSPSLRPLTASEAGVWVLKNRSTGNLALSTADEQTSIKLSIDTCCSSEYDVITRSALLEPEHGLGPSGLDRIRHQPLSRVFTLPDISSRVPLQPSHPSPRSATSRVASACFPANLIHPTFDDLHRFPSESLHSFSFARQSEEFLHSRQNILKRSIDFMRDRLGWGASGSGTLNAQTSLSGDAEMQSMMELLSKTNILDKENRHIHASFSRGPVTGPAHVYSENIFEKTFNEPSFTLDQSQTLPCDSQNDQAIDDSRFLSPILDGQILSQREMKSAPASRRVSLKRTFTDLSIMSLQTKLLETCAQPSIMAEPFITAIGLGVAGPAVHTHSSKWSPVSQAVFRTESKMPWTILAANDLACLVFGVTQAEVRKISILEVVQEERRQWLESKLRDTSTDPMVKSENQSERPQFGPVNPRSLGMGNGVTAQLLSKPPSRQKNPRRSQTDDGFGSSTRPAKNPNHSSSKSRGVLLCGDVVPIQKRNGTKGSASLWVMEKRGGLIWVLEEITENVSYISYDETGRLVDAQGDLNQIWGPILGKPGLTVTDLLPCVPETCLEEPSENGSNIIADMKYFAARTSADICVPTTVSNAAGTRCLRVSSFPHVAGMMVLSSSTLNIISSNSVFSSALFGRERLEGCHITELIPDFDKFLRILTEEDKVPLVDGIVIPEHSFRRARALSILRENKADAASIFLHPVGLPGKHRDGSKISVDVQMRAVRSERVFPDHQERKIDKQRSDPRDSGDDNDTVAITEVVYALWITYSRQIHAAGPQGLSSNTFVSRLPTPPPQPLSMQEPQSPSSTSNTLTSALNNQTPLSVLSQKLNEAASQPLTDQASQPVPEVKVSPLRKEPPKKKSISDYVVLEEMGQGAYGQVKLARFKKNPSKKVVLKYVTKKKILVDTWTRDRRLGTVPLEIHVLDYLRRDGLKHPNIVEMEGFFEDEVNYYIEMVPHGLPGMDLFDYIELRANMDEDECRNIFRQVVSAIHHLHTKALVVHRDIKDENVILDGDGNIKLIDFGSAAYIKNGPFDVFVGTIDYAAPEVLQGKPYRGKEQDLWALGILLYTIVYKENPFYNIDEILDHPLRIPFLPFSEDCIDLIRKMLDRDVDNRLTISEVMEHRWMTGT